MQAIDPRREALASLLLRSEGFDHYRCDRNLSLGLNLHDMAKMLRYAGNDDIVTITADDDDQDKIAEFEMKLMDLGYKHLEIPETRYDAIVQMPSSELARIYKELSTIGDTGVISVTKERLKFSIKGDNGTANIVCKQNDCVHKAEEATIIKMERPVSLTFRMSQVTVRLASEVPIVVEYMINEMGYLRFLLAPKIEDEVMVGHDTESVVKNKQPKKKLKTEPKSNENTKSSGNQETTRKEAQNRDKSNVETKRRVMKIDVDEDEEEIKPKIETNPNGETGGYVEVTGSKPGNTIIKPKEEVNGQDVVMDVKLDTEKETNGEAHVMDEE
ncbi:hypothetical protein L1987_78822 [Smallanthus sonchifolius]|uniref:Uncharacterized protein n=1 Tax=Smallanthus sonchifolius TaxID=185202 RepID=A0ACB8ZET8_9ASTR|nr:hypothetical protein L1987_78822 [Smallanthus sonchifolius]